MRLYEFESKEILAGEGVRVPRSQLITSIQDTAEYHGLLPGVVKIQTLSKKRSSVGGIQFVDCTEEVPRVLEKCLGQKFGKTIVEQVLLEERIQSEEEFFLSVSYDNSQGQPVVLFSTKGGIDIEAQALSDPALLHYLPIQPHLPFRPYQAVGWLSEIGFSGDCLGELGGFLEKIVSLFFKYDLLLLEINPLAMLASNGFVALDCHMEIDDDALQRFPLKSYASLVGRQEGERRLTEFERQARKIDASDHRGVTGRMLEFPGHLGLLIGGGGASLTIFDAIRKYGGSPANYCEVGGNPTVEKVRELTKLLVSRPSVQFLAIITNVVNNTQAHVVARGVIEGVQQVGKDPRDMIVVFRLPGSGEEECKKFLAQYGIPFNGREVSIEQAASLAVKRSARSMD